VATTYPIHIWINDERFEKLKRAGLEDASEDVLAGMRVIRVYCSEAQKDEFLKRYPSAKYDSSTTRSIELLPPDVKNRLFDLVIASGSTDVAGSFLSNT
jgi:hypothetical protein